jgi:hypothetical protein
VRYLIPGGRQTNVVGNVRPLPLRTASGNADNRRIADFQSMEIFSNGTPTATRRCPSMRLLAGLSGLAGYASLKWSSNYAIGGGDRQRYLERRQAVHAKDGASNPA